MRKKKIVVVAQLVVPFVLKRQFLWSRTMRDLNILLLTKDCVFDVISVLAFVNIRLINMMNKEETF